MGGWGPGPVLMVSGFCCDGVPVFIVWDIDTGILFSRTLTSVALPTSETSTSFTTVTSTCLLRKQYLVCRHCQQGWIWADRLVGKAHMKWLSCGHAWQQHHVPDLKKKKKPGGRTGTFLTKVNSGQRNPINWPCLSLRRTAG